MSPGTLTQLQPLVPQLCFLIHLCMGAGWFTRLLQVSLGFSVCWQNNTQHQEGVSSSARMLSTPLCTSRLLMSPGPMLITWPSPEPMEKGPHECVDRAKYNSLVAMTLTIYREAFLDSLTLCYNASFYTLCTLYFSFKKLNCLYNWIFNF